MENLSIKYKLKYYNLNKFTIFLTIYFKIKRFINI